MYDRIWIIKSAGKRTAGCENFFNCNQARGVFKSIKERFQSLTLVAKMLPGRGETICPVKHCCYKRSFISLTDVAVIMEQETSVGWLDVYILWFPIDHLSSLSLYPGRVSYRLAGLP